MSKMNKVKNEHGFTYMHAHSCSLFICCKIMNEMEAKFIHKVMFLVSHYASYYRCVSESC